LRNSRLEGLPTSLESSRRKKAEAFREDEHTKAALIEAGASEWSIYPKAELQVLVEQNRIAPLTDAELRKIHEIKRTFNARIT
jgi:hypothetical protein